MATTYNIWVAGVWVPFFNAPRTCAERVGNYPNSEEDPKLESLPSIQANKEQQSDFKDACRTGKKNSRRVWRRSGEWCGPECPESQEERPGPEYPHS